MRRAAEPGSVGRGAGGVPDLDVRQLRVLLALADRGSVTEAARTLGLAQSTVSEALASLDRAIGTPAVVRRRGARRLALTPAGQALLPHARQVLRQLDDARIAVANVARKGRARLDLMANESVSTYLLPRALGAVRRTWTNTRITVTIGMCADIRVAVAAGDRVLGLLLEPDSAPPPHSDAGGPDHTVLTTGLPMVAFAGLDHPLQRRAAVPRAEAAGFPIIISDAVGELPGLIGAYFASDGFAGLHLESAGSIEGVKRGVAADDRALGVLPLYAIAEDLKGGRWRLLALEPSLPSLRLAALLAPPPTPRHPVIAELLAQLRG